MVQHSESDGWDQAYRHLQHAEGLPFSELLPPERVARSAAALQIKYRARVFMPITVLWTFLSQVLSPDHSCREAVARFLAWRLVQGQEPCSTDTSSYCEARQRLPKELIQQLVRDTGCESAQAAKANWLWKGRHVKIVDGTTVILPDTAANQAAYPQPRSQPPGVGFPMARVVVVFSLACGAILDAAMGPMLGKKTGENALFRQLLSILQPNDVLLADRFYARFQEFARARARGADIVARQHQSRATDFRRGHWLGRLDHRVVMGRLRCRTPEMVEKEAWTHFLWPTQPDPRNDGHCGTHTRRQAAILEFQGNGADRERLHDLSALPPLGAGSNLAGNAACHCDPSSRRSTQPN